MKYRIREKNELKPSGVEWLGDIPNDWEQIPLGRLGNFTSSGIDKLINENESVVKIINFTDVYSNKAHILNSSFNYMKVTTPEKNRVKNLVKKGHLIFLPSSETYEDLGLSALVDEELENTSFSYHVIRLQFTKNIEHNFRKYLTNNNYILNIFSSFGNGTTRKTLNRDVFKKIKVLMPPFFEQQKIANFLDEKSKIFDEAISKKEQLISKLELAKQSLISEVVTGKLKVVEQNSKLQTIKREKKELKLSGVEWLGDIPKDWQVKKSKYLFEIRKRIAGTLDFDVLSITQKGIKIKDIETGGGQLSMDYSKYQIVNIGDFAMNHMDLLTGFVDIAKVQGVTSPDYRVFSLIDKNSDSNFYLYLFQMGYKNQIFFAFGQGSSQLGRWRFPTEEFNKFYFPYPSLEEQQKISKYLDEKLIHFDNTIEKTKQSITKLKEAKEALISQAVTGKIEVL